MISLHNILSIAKYERKTLLRSWFFRIFSGLSLLILFGMNFGMVIQGGGGEGWALRAVPSAIPYFNLLILNVAQAIIAVFLASDFLKRDKKLDTTEVIYMRSMTNNEYVIGKTWGNLQVFLVLNVLMSIIRNQAITFVIILGYIGITLFLLQAKYYYIFDYMAFNIPMLKSGIVGFGNLDAILIHRGIYFSLGIGFIFLTIFLLKRLPQSEGMTFVSLVVSILCIVAGTYLGFNHIAEFRKTGNIRARAVELNNTWVSENLPDVVKTSISLEHKGESLEAASTLLLKNNSETAIRKLVLSLNNGLKVSELKIDGKDTPFAREYHLIQINDGVDIQPGEEVSVELSYNGKIDEAFCYLDIDEKTFQEKYGSFVLNVDKRYSFVTPGYVLLTPETNWYPKPGVTFSSEDVSWYNPQFIDFSLEVKTNPSLKAVSQGAVKETSPGNFIFENDHPLTQLSLSIGDYEHRKFEENGIEYGIWYFKGHDFFSETFEEIRDTIPNVISERLGDFERTYDLQYSFDRLSLVEVPAQFKTYKRIFTSNQEMVQPEQVLIPEKAFMIGEADFENMISRQQRFGRRRDMGLSPKEMKVGILLNFLGNFTREQGRPDFRRVSGGDISVSETNNPYFIFANLYQFQNNITSVKWPVINRVFEAYLKSQSEDMGPMFMRDMTGMSEDELANIALQDSSFAEIIANPEEKKIIDNVIKLKGDMLFSMIQWKAGEIEFEEFLREILNENKFSNIPFEAFDQAISDRFGIELTPIMEDWFQAKALPGYIFSPIEAIKVKAEDMMRTKVSFKVTNFTDVEGVIKITFRLGGFGGGFPGFGMRGPGTDNTINKVLYLEPGQTKQVNYLLDADPRMMSVNTMTSQNIPQVITQDFRGIEEDLKAEAVENETVLNEPVSVEMPNEIIVDNEDPEFEVTTMEIQSLLQKWLLKENDNTRRYSGYNTWHPPSNWTLTTSSDFFGEYVRSGYYVKSGDGSLKAKWNVPVSEPGYYDVYYHLYKLRNFRRKRGRGRDSEDGEYFFTIHHDEGPEEVTLEYNTAEKGWNHLGSYYFSPDTALIELSNKSELSTINADAVKLVKL